MNMKHAAEAKHESLQGILRDHSAIFASINNLIGKASDAGHLEVIFEVVTPSDPYPIVWALKQNGYSVMIAKNKLKIEWSASNE